MLRFMAYHEPIGRLVLIGGTYFLEDGKMDNGTRFVEDPS